MNTGEILIYQNQEGNIKIDVRLEEETVWLTQSQICELFQKSKATISEHIKNVFEEGELQENAVVRKFRTTEASSNSPSSKMALICSLTVDLAFWNKRQICACVSQTVSSISFTSSFISPSGLW